MTLNPALRLMAAKPPASTYNPGTAIPWYLAVWANDPNWSNPGDGNAVSSWRDASGNARDLSQASGTLQPIYRSSVTALNNKAAVDFDGSNDWIGRASLSWSVPYSIVWIGKRDGAGGGTNERAITLEATSRYDSVFARVSTGKWSTYVGAYIDSTVSYDANGVAIREYVATGTNALAIVVNGTSTTGTVSGTPAPNQFSLGGYSGSVAGDYGNNHCAFAAVYAGDVTGDSGWSTFVSWVSTYYGLTIA